MLKSKERWARKIEPEEAGEPAAADKAKWHMSSKQEVRSLLLPAEIPYRLTSTFMVNTRTLKNHSFTLAKLHPQVSDPVSTEILIGKEVNSSFIISKAKSLRLSSEA